MRTLRTAIRNFRAHRGFFHASGLAFSFLTCLVPILFFIVSLAGFVLSRKAASEVVLKQLSELIPVYKEELHASLAEVIRRRRLSGLLGTGVLLLFASQLFASLRLVLNDIFGFSRGPGLLREIGKDLALLFLMGVFFLGSIMVFDLFGWVRFLLLTPAQMPAEWIRSLFMALAVGFSTMLFFVMYRYFPHQRVPTGPALAGALLAAMLWEAAKQGFRWYILRVGVYDAIYGPLGALVALGMFAYYSGIVFILGAEFTEALRSRKDRG
ncbi:MAG: YihY/virulence factor BrkB family protein [Candidatus Rokubacteria bacterium]|nr:YihY/virulence factor BrkB family protein [Candidatus Rokubacteria bacterium]